MARLENGSDLAGRGEGVMVIGIKIWKMTYQRLVRLEGGEKGPVLSEGSMEHSKKA